MPVPQENLSLVEQAGKPVHKKIIENVPDLIARFSRTGKMPVPQENLSLVEQAGKPVHKKIIENDARSHL
ncbi:hypothetical protein QUA70_14100 [Microcoleus sp. LAD1_D5]|uniref:hypothetical protein n=1 Tax=unclassified Microcoleus TaxID=2642155 RepID=UPI002FD044F9